jgi:DNA helicase-2/ATP-dependent DNA helicase PcrA
MEQRSCGSAEVDPRHLGLNAEQLAVVTHLLGPLLVAAVAGCGKTRAIVHRIAELVRRGVDEARILAVTFSAKAAKEMNDRLMALGVHYARVGTFHSVGLQIVREEWGADEFESWQVDDTNRYRAVVKEILGYRHMNWATADLTAVLRYISICKANAALPDSERALELARAMPQPRDPRLLLAAYTSAEELRRDRRLLTFDDMLVEAWILLCNEEVRERWAARWDHVLQDESQDENVVQRSIAQMLARDHRNYMIVGDPAQSIYGFRGSDPTGMLNFAQTWEATVVRMTRNYRSGRRIIEVANGALRAMPPNTHLGVTIDAERDLDGVVTASRFASFDEEGEGVVKSIVELHADGRPWKDCAVLYRTHAQSRGVEEALLSARVPYFVIGGTNFYDRAEVKHLLAYLRIAQGRANFNAVKRAINTPFRFLGRAFLDGLEEAGRSAPETLPWTDIVREHVERARLQSRQKTAALAWCSLMESMAATIVSAAGETATEQEKMNGRPAIMLERLIAQVGYVQWLTRDEGTESPENNRVSNVRELVRAAERFPTVDELLTYIEDTLQKAVEVQQHGEGADCVVLTSLHRSKGLEWPVVYMIGTNEKILPHARAEDDSEELRLFYVGATRARDELHFSCVCRAPVGARIVSLGPSKFLDGSGLEVRDHGSCRDIALSDREER